MLDIRGNRRDFIQESDIIDFSNPDIHRVAQMLRNLSEDNTDLIRRTFEYVRDSISHSRDVHGSTVTCKASEVMWYREGFCYAKSHLLAAILRANGIPCGFCYQRLILDDEKAPYMILHGLNAVYVEEVDEWIRIDARGNKIDVHADFHIDMEELAFDVRDWLGEEDIMIVFAEPDKNVIEKLNYHSSVEELYNDLPRKLLHG